MSLPGPDKSLCHPKPQDQESFIITRDMYFLLDISFMKEILN